MKPENRSKHLLSITRSKAKMYEYSVHIDDHIDISDYDPSKLYVLTIGLIGDLSFYVIEDNRAKIKEIKEELKFASYFFDAFLQSKLKEEHSDYLKLIGSASYYLCDLQGSASVLLKSLNFELLDLSSNQLDRAIYLVLSNQSSFLDGKYSHSLNDILNAYYNFTRTGDKVNLFDLLQWLRDYIYNKGTDREILFIDILFAIIINKYKNSSWVTLPNYSGLDIELWRPILSKDTFIKELWSSQHLLGEQGIYQGKSAVIQMPTSAGKTKSTELIIRSAFLANRANLTIIVAPFRALCNEIKNDMIKAFEGEQGIKVDEFTDVLQVDEMDDLTGILNGGGNNIDTILVSTPEKLYFILKQFPELASKIGLLIYDEGHQFDSGERGVTYELLLASLKTLIPHNIQTILISAVIGNASEINEWLNEDNGIVVEGTSLSPTYRTVAFASWLYDLGQVKFITPENPDNEEYFVPRVIESQVLNRRGRERTERTFPKKNDSNTIGLYLGLKLVNEGSVAIFSGTKVSVLSMCKDIVDAYDRGLTIIPPVEYSDRNEIQRLTNLYSLHFGVNNEQTKVSQLGIITHHGNLPQGIKLSVEYALQKSLAKYVICTSTLAQGVNLPIRYLIITSVYQGGKRLKIRDFHNLIGRAGRAGKYTEGSIIFSNNELYDKRRSREQEQGGSGVWKWNGTKELLNPLNSEASTSSLLTIFDSIDNFTPNINVDFLLNLLNKPDLLPIENEYILQQLLWKKSILNSIESYILMNMESEINIEEIIQNTLAYYSATDEKKSQLVDLFQRVKENIEQNIPIEKQKIYAKSLFGIDDVKELEEWLNVNYQSLLGVSSDEELFHILWNILIQKIKNNTFIKYTPNNTLENIVINWIGGISYFEIFNNTKNNNIKIGNRNLTIEHIINICEQALSFEGSMILSTLIELLELQEESEDRESLKENLKFVQKQIKYGLDTSNKIIIYELGFSDRVISQDLERNVCSIPSLSRFDIKNSFRSNSTLVEGILNQYPSYFRVYYETSFMSNTL
ncbi:MAG: DEAD/DEAH box helicase [Sulfurovum sp.]